MKGKESLIDLLIHDLTGPLSIVTSSTNSLLSRQEDGAISERQRQVLERILRNANKAKGLLHEMIEVYRSEEGLFRKEEFSITQVVRDALCDVIEITHPAVAERIACAADPAEVRRVLEENGVYVEITGRYCTYPFCHDQKKIQQILRNLISNALKFRREKIKLLINGDQDLLISVADDGSGIPEEKQAYIFKRFFKIKDKLRTEVEGLGFGLSCVKAMVETMKGEITLKSEEGTGTSFIVRIPSLSR
jgi:signal transduction histidine kinase